MYEIALSRKAQKFYDKASDELIGRLHKCFDDLSQDPYKSPNIKKLKGDLEISWRYRVGDYRVVYIVDEQNRNILISIIAHRRESYR
jgi:mRNA interferase RelE/StbE